MNDISQAAKTMGRKGGKSRSEAKQAAVRENGRKGGRPKGWGKTQQLRKLLQGYVYEPEDEDEVTLEIPPNATWGFCVEVAKSCGIRVWAPGEYHGRRNVVITDGSYSYALNDQSGGIETIAG